MVDACSVHVSNCRLPIPKPGRFSTRFRFCAVAYTALYQIGTSTAPRGAAREVDGDSAIEVKVGGG